MRPTEYSPLPDTFADVVHIERAGDHAVRFVFGAEVAGETRAVAAVVMPLTSAARSAADAVAALNHGLALSDVASETKS